jgi:ABC-type multidrug transport system fused ATPase/permease subunit
MRMRGYLEEEKLGKAFDLKLLLRLLKYLRPQAALFFISVALILALTAVELAMPYITKTAIDRFILPPKAVLTMTSDELARFDFEVIPLGGDKYLVDLSQLNQATRTTLESEGYLSQEQYLFIKTAFWAAEKYPEIFIAVPGGYIISHEDLKLISQKDLLRLREGDIQGLGVLAAFFGGLLILRFLFGFAQLFILQLTGQRVMYDMRRQIFSHLLKLPVRFFDKNPIGRLVTRATNDVAAINEMYTAVLVNLFRDVFLIVGIFIIMFRLNWRLAALIFVFAPILGYITLQFRIRARGAYREVRRKLAKLNAFIQESISGIRIIQLFIQEAHSLNQFRGINREKYLADIRQMLTHAVFNPLMGLMSSLAIALIIWYGGGGVVRGSLTLGALVVFISYVRMLFQPIMDLSEKYNILQGAMAASERIFLLLDEPQEDKGGGKVIKNFKGEIEFKDVWFAYDKEWVLSGVSFRVRPGERIAIVGPTGSGKTTIISLLLRLYDIQRGQILVDGIDIRRLDLSFLRSQMAVVLQDVFLFSGDVLGNIRLKEQIPKERAIEAARFAGADFIEEFPDEYRTEVKERGITLSAGQRQLLAFARAVAFEPKVLILDEATANIDSHTEHLIQQSLRKIMKGRTSIVIAHRLSTIREADKIIVLHKGRVIEEGTHEELLKQKGLYHALHSLQFAETKV